MKTLVTVLIIVVLVVVLFSIIATASFWKYAIYRMNRRPENIQFTGSRAKHKEKFLAFRKWYFSQDVKYEYIQNSEGLKLCTQILEHENSPKTVIMMHGFRAQDHDDFAGSVQKFYEDGFNIILPHQRGHEKSEGKYLTYGCKESDDCKDWVKFALDRYGKDSEIVLYGVSMGCATVILSLVKDLPTNVKACIADCGYTCASDIFKYVLFRNYHLPSFPIVNFCAFSCKVFAGFSIYETSPNEALKKNKIPVLFIHGDRDRFVPYSMSVKNFNTCTAEKEMLTIKGGTHAVSFLVDQELCWNTTKKFIEKYLENR